MKIVFRLHNMQEDNDMQMITKQCKRDPINTYSWFYTLAIIPSPPFKESNSEMEFSYLVANRYALIPGEKNLTFLFMS